MAITDDAVSFITNQIGIIISLILTIIMGFRWLQRENQKHSDRLEIKLLGKEKDGKGGIVNDLRQEIRKEFDTYMKLQEKDMKYMKRETGKMEKTLERITRGRYIATKSQISDEEIDEDDDYNGNGGYK